MNKRRNNSGKMSGITSLIAALLLLAVMVLPVSALQLAGQDVTATAPGGTVEYPIILDEAPAGLANYSITVQLADPAVGEITAVIFPVWATLNGNSTLPADSVNLTAADPGDGVIAGSTGITLATLTFRADAAGVTPVTVILDQMNDDNGAGMSPVIKNGSFTVTDPVPAPVAQFSGVPVMGDAPLTVMFTDESTGTVSSYAWDFENDGIVDSTEQNPVFIYNTAGVYTVNLTVTGPGGSDEEIKTDYITVTDPVPAPAAQFSGVPVSGEAPLTVTFTDESTGTISSYAWDFENDGIVDSTEQNPVFIYNTAGVYTVNLTVTGPGGSDEEIKTDYITVTDPVPTPGQKIDAVIRIEPETLNLKSSGIFTAFITLPGEYRVTGINADSIICEGAFAQSAKVIDEKKNEYMVKFKRQDLVNVITGDAVAFMVTGNLNTDNGMVEFAGSDTIRVIK